MPRHVLLVGLPGSGKTTVGRLAAEILGANLIDIDQHLVREMGMPIAQMLARSGPNSRLTVVIDSAPATAPTPNTA